MKATILVGDCRARMAEMEAESIDAIICDPPYGLGFMGKEWDNFKPEFIEREKLRDTRSQKRKALYGGKESDAPSAAMAAGRYDQSLRGNAGFQAWCETWAVEALRVLKPGGHLLAFGGTRTFHRLTCAIEDAGFEIRDCLSWLYGSGFPKSRNVGNGWGTALKPAWEPIILARKPLAGTVAANVQKHGTGAINVDGCRIGTESVRSSGVRSSGSTGMDARRFAHGTRPRDYAAKQEPSEHLGRWPANVLLDEDAAAMLDAQSGIRTSGKMTAGTTRSTRSVCYGAMPDTATLTDTPGDSGGASRFFYTAKASREDRNAGLEGMPTKRVSITMNTHNGDADKGEPWSPTDERTGEKRDRFSTIARNIHPTVKPFDLMRWLVRLVTPPGGIVLDPFAGSGSTGVAALAEGFDFIGIELSAEYAAIAEKRIANVAPMFAEVVTR